MSMADKKVRRSRQLRVCELFAGVGGFRLGLEGLNPNKRSSFRTVWANQWEPGKTRQNAADVYRARFGDGFPHFNEDIQKVLEHHFDAIEDHDVLCGGFPCQDYSVARTLSQATGIHGKKGVLWWSIHEIVERKLRAERRGNGHAPRYLVLENVDRLLKSPAGQRGRDFAVMLASLANLDYAVEWRVINSGEYGFPQRRKRIFIIAYHPKTATYGRIAKTDDPLSWIEKDGVLARAFPVRLRDRRADKSSFHLDDKGAASQENLIKITKTFNKMPEGRDTPFSEAGVMFGHDVWTAKVISEYEGPREVLGDVILDRDEVAKEFFIDEADRKKWEFLKGAKSIERISRKTGAKYSYDEGGIAYPDHLDRPSRTIITGEGGRTPSRFKHVIKDGKRLRRLTPIELERLNGFPDDHTKLDGVSDATRAFFMGNALVVGVVGRIGRELVREIRRKR